MIAGVDFDTHAVHVVTLPWDGERAVYHRHDLDKYGASAFDRARGVPRALAAVSLRHDLIAIESPKSNRFGTAVALARVQGAILALVPLSVPVLELAPAEWRKECGLPGNASKADVKSWARDRLAHTFEVWPQDAYDAYCIAHAARELCRRNAPEEAA